MSTSTDPVSINPGCSTPHASATLIRSRREPAGGGEDGVRRQRTASSEGVAELPWGASAVMIRTISARSAAEGSPHPGR